MAGPLFRLTLLVALLCQSASGQSPPAPTPNHPNNPAMVQPSNITRQSRAAISDLGDSCRLSLPFVAKLDERFCIGVLVYSAVPRPGKPSVVYPPACLLYLDADTCKLLKRVEIHPGEIVSGHGAGRTIGDYGIPAGMTYEEFLKVEAGLHAAVPGLCRKMNSGAAALSAADPTGREYRAAFGKISEQVLAPYYEKFGREFFARLKAD